MNELEKEGVEKQLANFAAIIRFACEGRARLKTIRNYKTLDWLSKNNERLDRIFSGIEGIENEARAVVENLEIMINKKGK